MKRIILALLLGVFCVLPLVSGALTDDLFAYYDFEQAGQTLTDGTGNGYDAYASSPVQATGVSGIIGSAWKFDGVDDIANVSSNDFEAIASDKILTVNAWINTSFVGTGSQDYVGLYNATSTNGVPIIDLRTIGTGSRVARITTGSDSGSTTTLSSGIKVNTDTWVMTTMVLNGTDFELYVNGTKITGSQTIESAGVYEIQELAFGALYPNLNWYNGSIDEVGFWDRNLSQAEITQLWNSGAGLNPLGDVSVTLESPANASTIITSFFNASFFSASSALQNATINIWNSTGALFYEQNNSVTGSSNSTTWSPTFTYPGEYTWNVYACSTDSCAWATANNSFTYGYVINATSEVDPVFETQENTIGINITVASGLSLTSANLTYNNTIYSSADIVSDGQALYITQDLISPSVSADLNITYNWTLIISGVEIVTENFLQQVNNLDIDNCTTNTVQILNYTFYDEDDRTLIDAGADNLTSEIYLKLTGDFTGSQFTYYANSSSSNPLTICINEDLSADTNYRLDSELRYQTTNRVTEYHNLLNTTINTTSYPLSYDIYDLLTSRSQEFLITVKDQNFVPIENALIEITRQYLSIGQFLTVEIPKTDGDGRTIGHFVNNDEVYTIFVKKDGELVATYDNIRLYCADANNDCRLNLNALSSTVKPTDFTEYKNISYSTNYNDSTRTYNFIFSTLDSSSKTFNVTGIKFDGYSNETMCSQQLTASSGQIQCIIPATYQNATAIINVYVDGDPFIQDIFPISSGQRGNFGAIGYFLAFILIATLPLIAYTSAFLTLVMFLLGLVASAMLGLLGLGGFVGSLSAFLWIVVAVGIIMWKMTTGGRTTDG